MTYAHPPRLARFLLRRFVSDDGLAGDVLESADSLPAGAFWKQVLVAIATDHASRRDDQRPIKLMSPGAAALPSPFIRSGRNRTVNITGTPQGVPVGGLGLVSLALMVTIVSPQTWWLAVCAVAGGIALGGILVGVSRHRVSATAAHAVQNLVFGPNVAD